MAAPKKPARLSCDERRALIIRAALRIFSEFGFHGATTRKLARAAGVSEALIFRHFPGKAQLYEAMQAECCRIKQSPEGLKVMGLDASTSSLVIMVHFLMGKMARLPEAKAADENNLHRLMLQSFMEDGEFARSFMADLAADLIAKLEACVKAAEKSGDMVDCPIKPNLRAWFTEHLAAMLMLNLLPGKPVVDFKATPAEVVEQSTWFALLGMGLRPEAIRRHYNPKALSLLTQ